MKNFYLDQNNTFIINDYQNQRPFSSTLPGIAGPFGIPIWAFYVNRGQAITSFGVETKDHPIMEFQPANKAYQTTPFLGFRTFIKVLHGGEPLIYEPFAAGSQTHDQRMRISLHELALEEQDPNRGLRVEVLYFVLPEERVAGLVRRLRITNLAGEPVDMEILDGLPAVIPYGVSNRDLKEVNRTVEAWMEVYNLDRSIPFFRLRSTLGDTAEVSAIKSGNFAYANVIRDPAVQRIVPIVDPGRVFGQNSSLNFPTNFRDRSLSELTGQPQLTGGKTPCAFFGLPVTLAPSESISLYSLYGFASSLELLNEVSKHLDEPDYFEDKRHASQALIDEITRPVATRTVMPVFDAYCRQTFLDNVMRGGWPVHLGSAEKPVTYHIYSRKHGDPERDYNAFFLAAEYFSQGNGNYRDVNQNRRSEVWFDPRVGDTSVRSFMSLIQADGYNPLVVKGSCFKIPADKRSGILELVDHPERLAAFLEKPFTPGRLLKWIDDHGITLQTSNMDFLQRVLDQSEQSFAAEFGEGYWVDHWTYNLDLIDSFLSIYPDRAQTLLFGREDLPYFQSPASVRPRNRKYVLVKGQPRQYESMVLDKQKALMIADRQDVPNAMRTQAGFGSVYQTNLYTKLVLLAVMKFATLDPMGMGIEMEAEKPAWCDALNGLPGLFGSSLSETFELDRLLAFLLDHLPANKNGFLTLPVELFDLIETVVDSLKNYQTSTSSDRDFHYWDAVSSAREAYRDRIRFGFQGEAVPVPFNAIADRLSLFQAKVRDGIARAVDLNEGIPPTYFTYDVEEFEVLHDADGNPLVDEKQRPYVQALRFRQKALPPFLEGPVHMFKTLSDTAAARRLYRQVKESPLYDRKLKMYKTNAPLENESLEIGRIRAFTPGWLENESVFLHMEYKYLLELLKAGLYEEFFEDFHAALVPFQDPIRYGRSPLENSSFIVSSAHPDASLHGAGFVARLTGATAEFLSMWTLMMAGPQPFILSDDQLCLRFQPALPGWLFDESGRLSFTFLGQCEVTYHNPERLDTFNGEMRVQSIALYLQNERVELATEVIPPPYVEMVRDGQVERIEVFFVSQ